MGIVLVKAKSTQKWYFSVSKPILTKISLVIFIPQPFLCKKNWVKIVPKQVFTGAGFKSPPSRCPFQRPFFVGFIHHANKVQMSIPIFQYCGPNLYNLQKQMLLEFILILQYLLNFYLRLKKATFSK